MKLVKKKGGGAFKKNVLTSSLINTTDQALALSSNFDGKLMISDT